MGLIKLCRIPRRFVCLSMICVAVILGYGKSLVEQQVDSLSASHQLIYVDSRPDAVGIKADADSIKLRMSEFYYDQFRHYSDPAAPYFLFMSKDAQLTMGIGGCVRMRGYYDWGGAVPASGFAPYLIPMHPAPTAMRHLGTTPAGTALFFRVLGRNSVVGDYQLYIECNFNGYQARDFHLKKAYAVINDITIGYASSTFGDPMAVPPTVDAQGPNNKITPTAVLVRYMPVFKERWSVGVSLETPATAVAADGMATDKVSNWLPDIAALLQYQWGVGQHVRLSGIVRSLPYRDLLASRNYTKVGWGLQLSSVAHPADMLTTYLTVNYGNGYQSLCGDMLIGSYDLVGDPSRPGQLYAPASFGWCAGVQYNFRPNLSMTIVASQMYYIPAHEVDADEYKNGFFGAVNVFWNPTPRIQVGAEFDVGFRRNAGGESAYARRVGAMAQFSF